MDMASKRGEQTGLLGWLRASAPEAEAEQGGHLHYDRGLRAWRRHEELVGVADGDAHDDQTHADDRTGTVAGAA